MYKSLKLKLMVILAGHIVTVVTCYTKKDDCNLFTKDLAFIWHLLNMQNTEHKIILSWKHTQKYKHEVST